MDFPLPNGSFLIVHLITAQMHRTAVVSRQTKTSARLRDVAGDDQATADLGPGAVEFHHGLQRLSLRKWAGPSRESFGETTRITGWWFQL